MILSSDVRRARRGVRVAPAHVLGPKWLAIPERALAVIAAIPAVAWCRAGIATGAGPGRAPLGVWLVLIDASLSLPIAQAVRPL